MSADLRPVDTIEPIDLHEAEEKAGALISIVAGPTLWAVHFLALYVAAAVVCAKQPGGLPGMQAPVLWGTGLAMALVLGLAWPSARVWWAERSTATDEDSVTGRTRFLAHAALLLTGLSLVAMLFQAGVFWLAASCR